MEPNQPQERSTAPPQSGLAEPTAPIAALIGEDTQLATKRSTLKNAYGEKIPSQRESLYLMAESLALLAHAAVYQAEITQNLVNQGRR